MLNLMLKRKLAHLVCLGGIAAGSIGLFVPIPSAVAQDVGGLSFNEKSFTKPSEERDLDFSAPGLVAEVTVKEGQAVKAGQLLARQDVSVETANKRAYDIEAQSMVEEEYAKKDVELKKVKHEKTVKLFNSKNATELEVREAQLEVERANASVMMATQKREIAAAQAATEQAKIDLKQIKSPIDGLVERLDTHVGEVATNQADRPAFRVVRNDPLWVDAHLPAAAASRLKKDETVQVRYVAEDKWMDAKVLHLQPKVRPGSQTRMVRLELPNPEERPAGLEVYVKLPDGTVAGAGGDSAGQPRAVVDR